MAHQSFPWISKNDALWVVTNKNFFELFLLQYKAPVKQSPGATKWSWELRLELRYPISYSTSQGNPKIKVKRSFFILVYWCWKIAQNEVIKIPFKHRVRIWNLIICPEIFDHAIRLQVWYGAVMMTTWTITMKVKWKVKLYETYMEHISTYLVAPTDLSERLSMLCIHLSLSCHLKLVQARLKHSHGRSFVWMLWPFVWKNIRSLKVPISSSSSNWKERSFHIFFTRMDAYLSFWQEAVMPVGIWVILTALSVVLTDWPPAPPDR